MTRLSFSLSIIILALGLPACAPVLPETPVVPITIQYTFAAQSLLPALQACAGDEILAMEKRAIDFQDTSSTDLILRLGEPGEGGDSIQVGIAEIIVISHPDNPISSLTTTQVQGIFRGTITNWSDLGGEDLGIQVNIFPLGEDITRIFLQTGLSGSPITSYARLASNQEAMAKAVAEDQGAVGLLTRDFLSDDVKEIASVVEVPVLAIPREGAPEAVMEILTCLQK